MIVQGLDSLYDTLIAEQRLAPEGFQRKPVRYLVELDDTGACLGVTDLGEHGPEFSVPEVGRSAGVKAIGLVDKAQYSLGVAARAGKESAALQCHEAFVVRLEAAEEVVASRDPDTARRIGAVRSFVSDRGAALADFEARGIVFELDAKGECKAAGSKIGFRVGGIDPTESDSFRSWWAEIVSDDLSSGEVGTCQATGVRGPLARMMPGIKVKPGTPQAMISANFAAALRYGAQQSSGAHLAVATAVRSHAALNWLLADEHHHRRVGELTFAWWLDGDVEFDGLNMLLHPGPDDVAALLRTPWTGRPGVRPDAQFRLLVLSLTEARVVVRMDYTTALSVIEGRVRAWLGAIEQQDRNGRLWWPSIRSLAEAAVPPGQGAARLARLDRVVDALARCALTGEKLPRSLLVSVLDRCRARTPSKLTATELSCRFALLNLYRSSQEGPMPEANSTGTLCGRMLAQLEAAQYVAMGNLNRTVVDRYYSAASVTPGRVLPGLLADVHKHLSKAGRSGKKGAEIGISRRLGELAEQLQEHGGLPATFSLEEQADFALGYWAERHHRYAGSNHHDPSDPTPTANDEELDQ